MDAHNSRFDCIPDYHNHLGTRGCQEPRYIHTSCNRGWNGHPSRVGCAVRTVCLLNSCRRVVTVDIEPVDMEVHPCFGCGVRVPSIADSRSEHFSCKLAKAVGYPAWYLARPGVGPGRGGLAPEPGLCPLVDHCRPAVCRIKPSSSGSHSSAGPDDDGLGRLRRRLWLCRCLPAGNA